MILAYGDETMYTEYMYKDSLTHHGILGQKWGKRNGPPYPLGYESHSKVEKKLNSKTRIDGKSETKGFGLKSKKDQKTSKINKGENKKDKHLTDKQKKILKGVAIGAGVAAAAGLSIYAYKTNPAVRDAVNKTIAKFKDKRYEKIKNSSSMIKKKPEDAYFVDGTGRKIYCKFSDGKMNPLAHKGFSAITREKTVFDSKTNSFKKELVIADSKGLTKTYDDILRDIEISNKGSKGFIFGRNHNCISNALNMEFRARGIDSVSKEQVGSYSASDTMNIFKTLNITNEEKKDIVSKMKNGSGLSAEGIYKELKSQPNGARGIIGCDMIHSDGKHFFNYIVADGEVYLVDGQQEVGGKGYDFIKSIFSDAKVSPKKSRKVYKSDSVFFIRTDNRNIDWNLATNYVEPNLGGKYNISDELADKWRRKGTPDSLLVPEVFNKGTNKEKTLYSIKKAYRYKEGPHERRIK